jgi:homoserine dehydrogenase
LKEYRLAFIGFGNVGKAVVRLFMEKEDELKQRYQISYKITGVATQSHGTAIDPNGLDPKALLDASDINQFSKITADSPIDFLNKVPADVLFENTPVNYETGLPAVDHLRAALLAGMHAITANKGPIVNAYSELSELAKQQGRKFFFESTVMDGAPIFSTFRAALPAANVKSFQGILNSTTNMILTRMEMGESFDQAVTHCQKIGIAETDPSGDVDGWDASVKVVALTTVLMGSPLKPSQVERKGIREISAADIEAARQQGKRWKLVCSAKRTPMGIQAVVRPELIGTDSPLYNVNGTSSIVQFETDVLGLLSIVEDNPGPHTTAYGLFADFLNSVVSS